MSGERQISIWAWHWWTWNLVYFLAIVKFSFYILSGRQINLVDWQILRRINLWMRCNTLLSRVKGRVWMCYCYHSPDPGLLMAEDRKHGDVFTGQVIICLTLSLSHNLLSAISTSRGKKYKTPGSLNRFIDFLSLIIEIQI